MRRRNVNVITVPPLIVIYCILHSVYTLDEHITPWIMQYSHHEHSMKTSNARIKSICTYIKKGYIVSSFHRILYHIFITESVRNLIYIWKMFRENIVSVFTREKRKDTHRCYSRYFMFNGYFS